MIISVLLLLFCAGSLSANSAITQWATGPGFNVYRDTIAIVLPGGKWSGIVPPRILPTSFPDGATFDAQIRAYDAKIGGKFTALQQKLQTDAKKNPLWNSTMQKIAALDRQVATQAKKPAINPQLQQAYTQAQQEYADTYARVAPSVPSYAPFKAAWDAYEKACLTQIKQTRADKENTVTSAMQSRGLSLQTPDTVFLIGQKLHLNVGEIDPEQVPDAIKQVIGANMPPPANFSAYLIRPSADAKCEPLRQKAAAAYRQLHKDVLAKAEVKEKDSALKQARKQLHESQQHSAGSDAVTRKAQERQAGLEYQYVALNQIVAQAANSMGLAAELQKYEQAMPAELKEAQKAYDAKADQAIDALDAAIQKVIQQEQQAQIKH